MNILKQTDRIKKIHKLILEEKTGTPIELADKLSISRSQLYNVIETLKEFDAPIKYSKKTNSFYYTKPFDLELKFSLTIILDEEKREIFGGYNFCPTLLDGCFINL
ncbi:HTH domain-containing protein [Flavobacterium sp.]|uniref:HTH domain-containing protein n=1 Tax=Flavobacterium sp. TaxID=239 RepID=UPI00261FD398|nr:HTH domain-containing protein [Flavobacterium sp.]